MRNNSNHYFSQVPVARIQRSVFDRSHTHKSTFSAGFLVPVFLDEVYPGDSFNLNMTFFARLATPIYPIMDNLYLDTFFFFVPNRLLWVNWERFNGAQDNPTDSTDFIVPKVVAPAGGYAFNSLQDYMGLRPGNFEGYGVSALYFRAYNLIFNDWFRDQNLQDSVPVPLDNGPDDPADYVLLRRGKRHDYFTSCLPWPQKGPSVVLPLGVDAPVVSTGVATTFRSATTTPTTDRMFQVDSTLMAPSHLTAVTGAATIAPENLSFGSVTGLETDLSNATAATINELREAVQLQVFHERDARGGTRYTEILKSHFRVTSPDFRLQRPEYLGGGSTRINVHPVVQNSESDVTPQGNLAAFGTALARHGFTKSFVEHGIVMGLVNVRSDYTYQQGIERFWWRDTRLDFYWPDFAHLGEQAVLNREIFTQANASDTDVFGYQERYAELRYKPSRISGAFRSDHPQSLDAWHLAQDFATLPLLNTTFIQETPPMDRVKAVTTEPDFIFDSKFEYRCARPMPVFGTPATMFRF